MSVRLMSVRLMDPRVGLFLGLFFAALALPAFAPATARAALAPDTAGPVSVTILHRFSDGSVTNDGTGPVGLMQGIDGNFYGTTGGGGSTVAADPQGYGYGTAYEITSGGASPSCTASATEPSETTVSIPSPHWCKAPMETSSGRPLRAATPATAAAPCSDCR